jgi:hypothetical protein
MSSIRIGFAVIGSFVAFSASASASADVRYTGSPKFGQFIASQAPAAAGAEIFAPGQSKVVDAKAQLLAPRTHVYKAGIGARGI